MTVITPSYQAAHLLPNAIRSVLGQTFEDWEHLIVDDGSRDNTLEVARTWARRDPRIRVVHLPRNGGIAGARNAGLRQARGSFVAFIDADDEWSPQFLEVQLRALAEAAGHTLATFCHSVTFDGRTGRYVSLHAPAAGCYDLARMFLGRCAPGNGSSLLIRRSVFEEAGAFDERLSRGEDVDMWLRCLIHCPGGRFVCVPAMLVYRRLHPGSRTTGRNFMIDEQVDTYADRLARFLPFLEPRYRVSLYLTYIVTVLVVRTGRAHRQSRLWALEALQLPGVTRWERLQLWLVPPLLRAIGPELYAGYRWQRRVAACVRLRHLAKPPPPEHPG